MPVFLYMLAKKINAMRQKEHKRLELAVEQGTKRIAEIDRLIEKVFEQNASGILSDERFSKMLQSYEKEQKALTQEVAKRWHHFLCMQFTLLYTHPQSHQNTLHGNPCLLRGIIRSHPVDRIFHYIQEGAFLIPAAVCKLRDTQE